MVTQRLFLCLSFRPLEWSIEASLNQGDPWVLLTNPKSPLCFDGGKTSGDSKASKRRYGCALEYGGLGVARLLRRWHRMEGGRGVMWLLRRKQKATRVSLF
ncbi:Pup--protein ligase [Gossypium arboreum]|uniref:Pup--protein ligase n=1 Tax=Gossypium arboreum TaxID=29729 RepID=A0A0B0NQM9_GOSAR|nr:Pup--protein ligase [Gossypium arboreum]